MKPANPRILTINGGSSSNPAGAKPKPEAIAKTPSDLTPQIAKRAYELYE